MLSTDLIFVGILYNCLHVMAIQTTTMVGLKTSSRTIGMVPSLQYRLAAGMHKYLKNTELENSRHQKSDRKQVPYSAYKYTKFSCPDNLAIGI